jgi:hypothetical protein
VATEYELTNLNNDPWLYVICGYEESRLGVFYDLWLGVIVGEVVV